VKSGIIALVHRYGILVCRSLCLTFGCSHSILEVFLCTQIHSENGVFVIVLEQFGGENVLKIVENDFDV
jgi:hypothetical protein